MRRGRTAALAILMATALAGCFEAQIPEAAVIVCDPAAPACPAGWECCGGVCEQQCACALGRCEMQFAVDCVEQQICLGGCWQDCPTCPQVCGDRELKTCALDDVEGIWFCRKSETCLVREADPGGLTADCHSPPPFCQGPDRVSCACLEGPGSLYLPCGPHEQCVDTSSICVTCRPGQGPVQITDAATGVDTTGRVSPDVGYSSGDAGTDGSDAGAPQLDAGSNLSDIPVVAVGTDAADSADHGEPTLDPETEIPDCFRTLGTGPTGGQCCNYVAQPAVEGSSGWQCPAEHDLAVRCDGFGTECLDGVSPACLPDASCVWSWWNNDQLQCTDYGPAAPCVSGTWQCYSGTSSPGDCDCVSPDCP